jgi:sigma-B regulation protein RsbU (phosphoserine phosphatase)
LFATFGNLIAFRILNYNLLAERHEKEIMDAEIRRATVIQGNLLARELPQYEGYETYAYQEQCRAVGGDLYDVRILPNDKLLFTLGDVSGKGMGAALLMSNIMASFRILYEDEEFDLCRAVERVSNQLWASSSPEDFATLFVGLVDNKTHKMSFVNAGHNPPYLVRKSGDIELLEASGCMIGAFNFASWSENSVELNEDDVVVIFTDGVVEAEKEDGQMYKEERLEVITKKLNNLSPREISRGIMDDIREFIQGAPQSDDITMLILKRVQ